MKQHPWRTWTDRIKRSDWALRLGQQLGRGRGTMRILDDWQTAAPPAPVKPDLGDWQSRKLSALWIGHATVLLRIGGLTVLTDPVFTPTIGLGLMLITMGPRRQIAPALRIKELPPIDVILISHAHFDHLDRRTLAALPKSPMVITAAHTRDLIHDLGYRRISELAWDKCADYRGVKFTALPVAHWGARTFVDSHRGYNAYMMESGGLRVLYAGDTAYHEGFGHAGPVDLAVLGIGAYDPYIKAHASPEQVWEMANQLGARHVMPIHHSTFRLSHEPMDEPMQRLLAAAGADASRIVIRRVGESWTHGN